LNSNHEKIAAFLANIMEELALVNSPELWQEFADQIVTYYTQAL
jgi:hypothetical protein